MLTLVGLVGLCAVTLVGCYFFWPIDKRSYRLALTSAAMLAALTGLAVIIARALPVTRTETVVKKLKYVKPPQIIYRDKIVYKIPGKEFEPVKPQEVCSGSMPITIDALSVNTDKENNSTTWVYGHIPGSEVRIICGEPGFMTDLWKVGATVQMIRATAQ